MTSTASPASANDDHGVDSHSFLQRILALDRALSRPCFEVKLPLPVEVLLSIPGNCFGLPFVALAIIPNVTHVWLAAATHPQFKEEAKSSSIWLFSFATFTLATLGAWIGLLCGGGHRYAQVFYSSKAGALAPIVGALFLQTSPFVQEVPFGFFQLSCWCAAIIPVAFLKPLLARQRPGSTAEFSHISKHLGHLTRLIRLDALQSFPSGDVAGAVGVMYPLWRCYPQARLFACCCVGLSIFGRLYWLAHHAIDVAAGGLLALPFLWLLESLVSDDTANGECRASLTQAVRTYVALIVVVLTTRRLMKKKMFGGGTLVSEKFS